MKNARVNKNKSKTTPFRVRYYSDDGDRKEKYFRTYTAATIFAAGLNDEKKLPKEYAFTPEQRIELIRIVQLADTHNVRLAQIVDLIARNIGQTKTINKTFNDAFFSFKEDLERRKARPDTERFYSQRCEQFKNENNITDISEITQECANNYLAKVHSPLHMRRAMSAFSNFCIRHQWLAINPFKNAVIPKILKERAIPEILTISETKTLFENLKPEHIPAFALMAFAGVRPGEIITEQKRSKKSKTDKEDTYARKPTLQWEHIDIEHRRVKIPASIAKTKRERLITDIPETLWIWLEVFAPSKKTGAIFPFPNKIFRCAKERLPVKIPFDALRHSFGTYAYHTIGRDHTIDVMGHDIKTYEKHYKALATKSDSLKYFEILPPGYKKPEPKKKGSKKSPSV